MPTGEELCGEGERGGGTFPDLTLTRTDLEWT